MWLAQGRRPAPVGLGDTVEHGLEAGQHQAPPGKETLQVPEGMPSRRILSFLFKKGGYRVHSPYNHSRCQLSAATAPDWWFVSFKTVSKTNLLITSFTAKERCCISRPWDLPGMPLRPSHHCASGSVLSCQLCYSFGVSLWAAAAAAATRRQGNCF